MGIWLNRTTRTAGTVKAIRRLRSLKLGGMSTLNIFLLAEKRPLPYFVMFESIFSWALFYAEAFIIDDDEEREEEEEYAQLLTEKQGAPSGRGESETEAKEWAADPDDGKGKAPEKVL